MELYEMEGFLRGKCLPGDLLVGESIAQYLTRKLNEGAEAKQGLHSAQLTISQIIDLLGVSDTLSISEQVAVLNQQVVNLAVENTGLKGCIVNHTRAVENWNSWADPEDKITNNSETPATDAAIANIQAQGVEKYGNLTIKIGEEAQDSDIIYAGQQALLFAAQLRKGGTHD